MSIDWINEELRCEEGIRRMAAILSDRLKEKRGHGRHGWHDPEACGLQQLRMELHDHLVAVMVAIANGEKPSEKDVVDAMALLMFYWNRVYGQPKTFGH